MTDNFNNSPGNGHQFSTLVDLLRYRALHQPDKTAYTFLPDGETPSHNLTYQELDERARAIATVLQRQGATGEGVLLFYPAGLDFIAAFFGCLYAGAIAVPAYPPPNNQKLSRLQAIVADSKATLALTTAALLANIKRRFAQELTAVALAWLTTDNLESNLASDWQEPGCNQNTLAFLQYTSGSTGTPKGVMITHGNLLYNSALINRCFEDTTKSRGVSWLPPYHDMGLIGGVLQPLYVGAPMILMSPVDFLQKPWRWLEAISRYRVTTSGGPNFAYDLCVRKIAPKQRTNLDLSSWEFAFTGAEPVRAETLERFTQAFAPCGFRREAFYPCYGMAETTLFVSGGLKAAPPMICKVEGAALEQNRVVPAQSEAGSRTLVGCGRTWLDEKIAIASLESLTQCAEGQVGEIWVSGPSVAQGYWQRAEETEQTFNAYLASGEGPFLRTGDLGFVQDGELFITGRRKDLIIIRGRNHYPQDIELTGEQSHPALRPGAGAAFAVEVDGSERLAIAQEVERSYLRKLDVEAIVEAVRSAVSKEHELQVYAVLLLKTGSIPKTSSGKIQRHACRQGFLDESLNVVGRWQLPTAEPERQQDPEPDPTTAPTLVVPQSAESIQSWIVDWLVRELNLDAKSIDVAKSFADYGFDSVSAVELADGLQGWLGLTLSPTLAYEYPTIEALSHYLAKQTVESLQEGVEFGVDSNGDDEVDQLLSELEELSEAEVLEVLGKQTR